MFRNKGSSFINIIGLTVGITAFLLIFLYVRFENNYDTFHTKADRIYRLACDIKTSSGTVARSLTSRAMAVNLAADFPEVEATTSLQRGSLLVRKDDAKFQETNTLVIDPGFFSIFDFPVLKGDPGRNLANSPAIIFSESAVKKYFGPADPVGQHVLVSQQNWIVTVAGVIKNIPDNSQITADILFYSGTTIPPPDNDFSSWKNLSLITYVLLKEGTNAKTLEAKLPAFLEKHIGPEMIRNRESYTLALEPLKSVYLHSKRGGMVSGNVNNVRLLAVIALFILLMAGINFINLSTARSSERAKEVGIRKISGAGRWQLIRLFMGESLLLCLISFLLSLGLAAILLPLFNQLAGKTVCQDIFRQISLILDLLLLTIGIGLAVGIYSAFILSAYKPMLALKGYFKSGTGGIRLRKGLVILQFTISTALIIGTIVIYSQIRFMRNQDLGFNKEQDLVINTRTDPHGAAFKREIGNIPAVVSAAFSSAVPGAVVNDTASVQIENQSGDLQSMKVEVYSVDFNFLKLYRIRLLAGRSFSTGFGTDSTRAIMVNETAAKMLGYLSPQQAVGGRFALSTTEGKIIGVIRDLHTRSLQEPIMPLILKIDPGNHNEYLSIKVSTNNLPATLQAIEKKWNDLIPYRPFNYFFLDEFFDKQYRADNRFGNLFLSFSVLVLLVACLGLYGLSSFSTLQRTKEMAIRKIVGASVTQIVALLSRDFLKYVVISFFIACPSAWYFMHRWLMNYAYRIDITPWIFLSSGLLILVIALATTTFQAINLALKNPVNSLRTE